MRYVKTIEKLSDAYLINGRVIIDNYGTLWNAWYSDKKYKDFPKYYFELRDQLMRV